MGIGLRVTRGVARLDVRAELNGPNLALVRQIERLLASGNSVPQAERLLDGDLRHGDYGLRDLELLFSLLNNGEHRWKVLSSFRPTAHIALPSWFALTAAYSFVPAGLVMAPRSCATAAMRHSSAVQSTRQPTPPTTGLGSLSFF